jgi:hypothetical protein
VNDLTQNAVFAALLPIFKQFLDEPDIELTCPAKVYQPALEILALDDRFVA